MKAATIILVIIGVSSSIASAQIRSTYFATSAENGYVNDIYEVPKDVRPGSTNAARIFASKFFLYNSGADSVEITAFTWQNGVASVAANVVSGNMRKACSVTLKRKVSANTTGWIASDHACH